MTLTVHDIGHGWAQATGKTPGTWPVSGPWAHLGIMAGAGLLGGRYLGSPILQKIMGGRVDPERANRVGAYGGLALGALAAAPYLTTAFSDKQASWQPPNLWNQPSVDPYALDVGLQQAV